MELLYCILGVGVVVIVLIIIPFPGDRSVTSFPNAAHVQGTRFSATTQDVLVGTLRNREQLDVCLQCGFYHIPCAQVSDTEHPIRYIAVYQSVTLFGPEAGVRYYGRVSECVTVPRYQITQIYSESDEPYFVFRVQEWKQLPAVITPKESAFVSKRTSMFGLLHSVEVPQLWTRTREEFAVYEMLRRAALGDGSQDTMTLNDCTIGVRKNKIRLQRGKKLLWSCPIAAFEETPHSVMLCLREYIGF